MNSYTLILLLLKKIGNAMPGGKEKKGWGLVDPSPTLPTYRGKEKKGKIVKHKK